MSQEGLAEYYFASHHAEQNKKKFFDNLHLNKNEPIIFVPTSIVCQIDLCVSFQINGISVINNPVVVSGPDATILATIIRSIFGIDVSYQNFGDRAALRNCNFQDSWTDFDIEKYTDQDIVHLQDAARLISLQLASYDESDMAMASVVNVNQIISTAILCFAATGRPTFAFSTLFGRLEMIKSTYLRLCLLLNLKIMFCPKLCNIEESKSGSCFRDLSPNRRQFNDALSLIYWKDGYGFDGKRIGLATTAERIKINSVKFSVKPCLWKLSHMPSVDVQHDLAIEQRTWPGLQMNMSNDTNLCSYLNYVSPMRDIYESYGHTHWLSGIICAMSFNIRPMAQIRFCKRFSAPGRAMTARLVEIVFAKTQGVASPALPPKSRRLDKLRHEVKLFYTLDNLVKPFEPSDMPESLAPSRKCPFSLCDQVLRLISDTAEGLIVAYNSSLHVLDKLHIVDTDRRVLATCVKISEQPSELLEYLAGTLRLDCDDSYFLNWEKNQYISMSATGPAVIDAVQLLLDISAEQNDHLKTLCLANLLYFLARLFVYCNEAIKRQDYYWSQRLDQIARYVTGELFFKPRFYQSNLSRISSDDIDNFCIRYWFSVISGDGKCTPDEFHPITIYSGSEDTEETISLLAFLSNMHARFPLCTPNRDITPGMPVRLITFANIAYFEDDMFVGYKHEAPDEYMRLLYAALISFSINKLRRARMLDMQREFCSQARSGKLGQKPERVRRAMVENGLKKSALRLGALLINSFNEGQSDFLPTSTSSSLRCFGSINKITMLAAEHIFPPLCRFSSYCVPDQCFRKWEFLRNFEGIMVACGMPDICQDLNAMFKLLSLGTSGYDDGNDRGQFASIRADFSVSRLTWCSDKMYDYEYPAIIEYRELNLPKSEGSSERSSACPVCREAMSLSNELFIDLRCRHIICRDCHFSLLKTQWAQDCPLCRGSASTPGYVVNYAEGANRRQKVQI